MWPRALITTMTDTYARVSMHGVRRELVVRQAEAAGVALVEVAIPVGCTNDIYEQQMAAAFASESLR
ncbi:MAG: ATP-binding protein, partial [Candidatus Baltobacteraceae bacterium]